MSHSWTELGDYGIKARAKDINGARGIWSDPFQMHIGMPSLKINTITGGLFKVDTTIENTGEAEATDVQWSINLDGGLILIGKETTGEIEYMAPGDETPITSKLIFGFGKTLVIATAEIPEDSER